MRWAKCLAAALLTVCLAAGTFTGTPNRANAAVAADQEWPLVVEDAEGGQTIWSSLSVYLRNQLPPPAEQADNEIGPRIWELKPDNMPAGFSRKYVAVVHRIEVIYVVLLVTDESAHKITMLDKISESPDGQLVINMAKLELSVDGSKIKIWSQAPFRATQSEAVLEWNGKKLNIVSHVYSDPSASFFEHKSSLLKKGDLAGLMKLEAKDGGGVSYPLFYEEYFTLAAPTLQLAYKKAMEVYRKGDAKIAVNYLHYGLQQYTDPYGMWDWENGILTIADLNGDPEGLNPPGRLGASSLLAILNDYGFFLSEARQYKQAKPILLNVIKLAPSRTVAYLNVADTEWELGEKKSAKAHYKQYLKLLGKNASKAPKRVQQRLG